jgi:GTP-binding protein
MKVQSVEFIKSCAKVEQKPKERLPEIAFLGPSNVGKSSLINSLLGRKGVAKVSKTPGRTQLLNYFKINEILHFVDLPGYGFAKVPKKVQESFIRAIEGYLAGSEELVLLVLLQDCRRTPSSRDLELRGWLTENDVPHAIVLTKVDKLKRGLLNKQKRIIEEAHDLADAGAKALTYSAKTGAGRRELWAVIAEAAEL